MSENTYNNDKIIRGITPDGQIRFLAASTAGMVEEARRIHNTSPLCTAALGRLLTAAAIMGALNKNDGDQVTISIDGDGPIGRLSATADSSGYVRGLIQNPHVELPLNKVHHLDVGGAVGHGTLSVIRDLGIRDPYIGQTALVTGEIAEDITYYYAASEQIPTSTGLGVLVDRDGHVLHAGGFLIQLLPFATEETIDELEAALSRFPSVTECFTQGDDPEAMVRRILEDVIVEETTPVGYRCNCSRDRVTKALISLGKKELQGMILEGKDITLHCDFCNKDYVFHPEELEELCRNAQHEE